MIDIDLFDRLKQIQADYELVKLDMAKFTSRVKDEKEQEEIILSAVKYARGG